MVTLLVSLSVNLMVFTVLNRICEKAMFSQASVILSTGGAGRHPPGRHTQTWTDTPPQETATAADCILLECILVDHIFAQASQIVSFVRTN